MKIFISYSSKQLLVAQKIKDFLDKLEIDSFLANDDLRTASNWKDRIFIELQECQVIVPILSKEFKESDWCSQEIGICFFQSKKIIPISFDETRPYGFINHIQSKFIKDMFLELIISEGLMESCNNFNGFICLLKDRLSFRTAEEIFKTIEPYFEKINKNDLNSIIDISIKNSQIWSAAECSNKYLPKLLKLRKDDIKQHLLDKIKYQIKNQKWYKD